MVFTEIDKLILIGKENYSGEKSMLNDNHIEEFNSIIKTCINFSMQSTLLLQRPQNIVPVSRNEEYLQILFSGNSELGHWIFIWYFDNIIHIYDSLNSKHLNSDQMIFINRLFPNKINLQIVFETVQDQNNTYDCGIFAIAFAVSIIFNSCPCVLMNYLYENKINVLSVAWTGIAANLLKNGKTVHTTFKLPFNITSETVCNIIPQSKLNSDTIFDGKVVIVSGYFRQTLPIVKHVCQTHIIENCIKNSELWREFNTITLKDNKRISDNDSAFKEWLLNVGDGIRSNNFEEENELISLPEDLLCIGDIVEEIFGSIIKPYSNQFQSQVILAPTKSEVSALNDEILLRIEGTAHEYVSVDAAKDSNSESVENLFPIEFLNSLLPNGLPPHKLQVKEGAIVILLRNINLSEGLCNGTRLVVLEMNKYFIYAKIMSGFKTGTTVFLPRMNLSPAEHEFPFNMTRKQFSVRLGSAMTINKSQGQSFDKVGLYLSSPVFSHGQLYVALSRTTCRKNLRILLTENSKKCYKGKTYTKNVVFHEII